MPRLSVAQRQQAFEWHQEGHSIESIARCLDCKRRAVARWIAEGLKRKPNWHDAPGRGRKAKLASRQKTEVRRYAARGHTSTSLVTKVQQNFGQQVSKQTVRNVLHSGSRPLTWRRVQHSRLLSNTNQQLRLEYSNQPQVAPLANMVFIDGKHVTTIKTEHGYAHSSWQHDDQKPQGLPTGKPIPVFIYAAIALGHKSKVYFVAPTPPLGSKERKGKRAFSGADYCSMMKRLKCELTSWFPNGDYVIIRDRAKQHTSRASTAAVKALNMPVDTAFPPQSWDLNVIETAWAQLDHKLLGCRASSLRGWRDAVQQAWDEVPQATIDKLVESFPRRMQGVAGRGGSWPSKYRSKVE